LSIQSKPSIKPKLLTRAYIGLGLGILTIGFSAIFVRAADAPGTMTAFYRMAIGSSLMLLPFIGQARRKTIVDSKRGFSLSVLGGILFGLDLTFWTTGVVMSGAAIPTLMANTAPLWVGLGAWLIFRETLPVNFWIGLLIALVGAAVILGQDFSRSANFGIGGIYGLLAGVFYGAYYLVSQRARTQVRTLPYFWITTTSSAIFLLIINLILGHSFFAYDRGTYLNFLGIGVFVQVIGWLAINYAQGNLPAPLIAATLLAQPVLTAFMAWIFLGEIFTIWQVLGGIAIISGIYIVHRSRISRALSSRIS